MTDTETFSPGIVLAFGLRFLVRKSQCPSGPALLSVIARGSRCVRANRAAADDELSVTARGESIR